MRRRWIGRAAVAFVFVCGGACKRGPVAPSSGDGPPPIHQALSDVMEIHRDGCSKGERFHCEKLAEELGSSDVDAKIWYARRACTEAGQLSCEILCFHFAQPPHKDVARARHYCGMGCEGRGTDHLSACITAVDSLRKDEPIDDALAAKLATDGCKNTGSNQLCSRARNLGAADLPSAQEARDIAASVERNQEHAERSREETEYRIRMNEYEERLRNLAPGIVPGGLGGDTSSSSTAEPSSARAPASARAASTSPSVHPSVAPPRVSPSPQAPPPASPAARTPSPSSGGFAGLPSPSFGAPSSATRSASTGAPTPTPAPAPARSEAPPDGPCCTNKFCNDAHGNCVVACETTYPWRTNMKLFDQNQSCKTHCMLLRADCYRCCEAPKSAPGCNATYCFGR